MKLKLKIYDRMWEVCYTVERITHLNEFHIYLLTCKSNVDGNVDTNDVDDFNKTRHKQH